VRLDRRAIVEARGGKNVPAARDLAKNFSQLAALLLVIGYDGLAGFLDSNDACLHFTVDLLRDRFAVPRPDHFESRTAGDGPL
jgi:hypothetical protein